MSNLTNVVTAASQGVTIVIERTEGIQTETRITYNTSQPRQEVVIGQLQFQPALPHIHFTQIQTGLSFSVGQASASISVNVIDVESTPVAFFVQISSPLQ